MKNDDDKKSAPLHLFIPSKVTCMLILLLLRFLWKPSPSLPLSKKRQSNSATYQEQSSRKRYLLQQFLYVYDSEDMYLFCVCLLHLAADGNPKWAHSTATSVRPSRLACVVCFVLSSSLRRSSRNTNERFEEDQAARERGLMHG
jgi:hypothetical protein